MNIYFFTGLRLAAASVTLLLVACNPPASETQTPVVDDGAALRNKCITQAKSQGYRNGQCAYSFIKACIETQSRSQMEAALRTDAALGMGTSTYCPNMPSTYAAEFDKF